MYARPIYRPVQAYNSENKCFLPIITAKAVVYIHINIYELSYAAWSGCLSLYSMKECQNAQPCLLSNYFTGGGSEKAYVRKNKVFYYLNSIQVMILEYTALYILQWRSSKIILQERGKLILIVNICSIWLLLWWRNDITGTPFKGILNTWYI